MGIDIVSGQAAAANVAQERFFLMLYGPPGSEKTTDAVKAFTRPDGTCSAFWIPCEEGALKPILARGLPVPDHPKETVKSAEALGAAIAYAAENRAKYSAVVIDTISTWTANEYKNLEDRHKGTKNKFIIPMQMRDMLYQLRAGCRALGLHVVMIAHEQPPIYDMETGVLRAQGGPLFVPKTAIELFYGVVDTVLRVGFLKGFAGPQRVYFTGGTTWPQGAPPASGDWTLYRAKNREGVGFSVVPADLAGFLRMRQPPYPGL